FQLMGFDGGDLRFAPLAPDAEALCGSDAQVAAWFAQRKGSRVLDLGSRDDPLIARLEKDGHRVTRATPHYEGIRYRFYDADAPATTLDERDARYEVVLASHTLDAAVDPERLLVDVGRILRPGGTVFVVVTNFAHWYVRLRVASGTFAYREGNLID